MGHACAIHGVCACLQLRQRAQACECRGRNGGDLVAVQLPTESVTKSESFDSDSFVVLAYNWTSAVRPENAFIATVAIWLLYRYLQIV